MFYAGAAAGVVVTLLALFVLVTRAARKETSEKRIQRELLESKRTVRKIFDRTVIQMENAVEEHHNDLPSNWREYLK